MWSKLFLLILLAHIAACTSSEPEVLYKIPRDEIVLLVKHGKLNYPYAKFLNQDGTELTEAMRKRLNRGELGKDYFADSNGVIKEVRVRSIELADKIIEIQKRGLSHKPLSKIELIKIDCEKVDSIYAYIDESYKEALNRNNRRFLNNHNYQFEVEVDSVNQQIVVSTITECGFSEKHLETIMSTIRRGPTSLMTYYYSDFKTFSNQGKLSKGKVAEMEDLMLMRNRYPQIYGTQIRGGHIYNLEFPEYVNERRARMDLEPIEEYIAKWDINFEDELKRMKATSQ